MSFVCLLNYSIKIQKITKVEPAEPTGMIGVWAGVSKEDIFEIKI